MNTTMTTRERDLARDCWQACNLLRHPTAAGAETPPWLAATAALLAPSALPSASETPGRIFPPARLACMTGARR